MPFYEYRCQACGQETEVLQKISDPPRTVCPSCGAEALLKKVSAAGFQLKGTGWYVTDFRGGSSAPKGDASKTESAGEASADQAKTAGDKPAPPATDKAVAAPAESAKPSESTATIQPSSSASTSAPS